MRLHETCFAFPFIRGFEPQKAAFDFMLTGAQNRLGVVAHGRSHSPVHSFQLGGAGEDRSLLTDCSAPYRSPVAASVLLLIWRDERNRNGDTNAVADGALRGKRLRLPSHLAHNSRLHLHILVLPGPLPLASATSKYKDALFFPPRMPLVFLSLPFLTTRLVAITPFFFCFVFLCPLQEPIRSRGWPLVVCSVISTWIFLVSQAPLIAFLLFFDSLIGH